MTWSWVLPADPSVLEGRPLLDLGTGDGQTLRTLAPLGFVVGVDRDPALLRRGAVNAEVDSLPFRNTRFATVLAADLFHHLEDAGLDAVLREVRRVLRPGGRLVAWWYEHSSDPSPDAPRHSRSWDAVASRARATGLRVYALDLVTAVPTSPTVGLVASV